MLLGTCQLAMGEPADCSAGACCVQVCLSGPCAWLPWVLPEGPQPEVDGEEPKRRLSFPFGWGAGRKEGVSCFQRHRGQEGPDGRLEDLSTWGRVWSCSRQVPCRLPHKGWRVSSSEASCRSKFAESFPHHLWPLTGWCHILHRHHRDTDRERETAKGAVHWGGDQHNVWLPAVWRWHRKKVSWGEKLLLKNVSLCCRDGSCSKPSFFCSKHLCCEKSGWPETKLSLDWFPSQVDNQIRSLAGTLGCQSFYEEKKLLLMATKVLPCRSKLLIVSFVAGPICKFPRHCWSISGPCPWFGLLCQPRYELFTFYHSKAKFCIESGKANTANMFIDGLKLLWDGMDDSKTEEVCLLFPPNSCTFHSG